MIDQPHRLVMSGRAIDDALGEIFATLMEITVVAGDDATVLTIRQSHFYPLPPVEVMSGAEQGWSEQRWRFDLLLKLGLGE